MAEETKVTTTETTETNQQQQTNQEHTPTVDELMAQLATERAEKERYKTANDKLSKSEAEIKRQLRAKQTAEEQEAEAQKEAQRLADEERENLRKENNRYKALSSYKTLDEETVDTLLEAISDADHTTIASIIDKEVQKAVKEAESKWIKERPNVRSGVYSTMTKEQILAIPDTEERIKAIAQNRDLF